MEWISVKEKLPDSTHDVLVLCSEMLPVEYSVAYYQKSHKSWYKQKFGLPDRMITHWMELPKPPQK